MALQIHVPVAGSRLIVIPNIWIFIHEMMCRRNSHTDDLHTISVVLWSVTIKTARVCNRSLIFPYMEQTTSWHWLFKPELIEVVLQQWQPDFSSFWKFRVSTAGNMTGTTASVFIFIIGTLMCTLRTFTTLMKVEASRNWRLQIIKLKCKFVKISLYPEALNQQSIVLFTTVAVYVGIPTVLRSLRPTINIESNLNL